jgi:hypothetical protein
MGTVFSTPSILLRISLIDSTSLIPSLSKGWIKIWPFNPTILLINYVRNPFITDITTTKTATPDAIPKNETRVMTEKKPSLPFGLRYLLDIHHSKKKFFSLNS